MADQGAVGVGVQVSMVMPFRDTALVRVGQFGSIASISGRDGRVQVASTRGSIVAASPGWLGPTTPVKSPTSVYSQTFTPTWWGSRPIGTLPYPEGSISGQVYQRTDNGDTILPRCEVRLYYRRNGVLIGVTDTNSQGRYSFDLLMPEEGSYYAVALDPEGAPVQNSAILDALTPVYSVPVLIRYSVTDGFQDLAYVAFRPQAYYTRGILSWTSTALPAGLAINPATGVISGTPTAAFNSSVTITVIDADKRSASVTIVMVVKGEILRSDTLLGRDGLAAINTSPIDDSYWNLSDIGFDFRLDGLSYRTNLYVGSNSYITFGFGSPAYSSLSATNPGRALLVAAADRSNLAVYAGQVTDGYRIRFEGNQGTSGSNPPTLLWELTLYRDNTMVLVMGTMPTNGEGLSMLSNGVRQLAGFTPREGKAYLFQENASGGWSVKDFVKPTKPSTDPAGVGDENTLSLLHFDGADQATTITDETGRAWDLYDGAKLTTSAKKFGSASLQFSGKINGQANVSRAYSQLDENHTFGADDFCVEIQAKQDQRPYAAVLACVDWEGSSTATVWKAWAIVIDSDGIPYCQFSGNGVSSLRIKASYAVPLGSFIHYAMTREGGTLRFFVNGALAGTADVTNLIMWKSPIGICLGSWPTAQADGLVGQLDEFRMTRGKAVYTAAFTPPTDAFPAYVPPPLSSRPGAGYMLNGQQGFIQSDLQGPMMSARTLMLDFKVQKMPPEGDWSVFMQASYDGWGSPFIAVSRRQDLSYGDLGWYIRQGTQLGTQSNSGLTESNGTQVTRRRHRLLIVLKGTQPTNPNYSEFVNADYILDGRVVNADVAQTLLAMPDRIGRGSFGLPFIGTIYGVAIWNRTLTAAEQTRLWNDDSYDLAKYPGLLDAWLPRKFSDGQVANEVSGRPPLRLASS